MPRRPPVFSASGVHYGDPVTLAAGTVTAGGSGSPVSAGEWSAIRLTLAVTAASGGTPSMTVTVEHSQDAVTWVSLGSFAARTAAGSERKVFTGLDRYVRCTWAVSGTTPSFTFSVAGEAV